MKKNREIVFKKFEGLCAYSGTPLKEDWQIDHLEPVVRDFKNGNFTYKKNDRLENLMPCQKIINHYKHSMSLEKFRSWILGGLHERLKKMPKNPKSDKTIRRKIYLNEIANYFNIDENTPFCGKFYFETLDNE